MELASPGPAMNLIHSKSCKNESNKTAGMSKASEVFSQVGGFWLQPTEPGLPTQFFGWLPPNNVIKNTAIIKTLGNCHFRHELQGNRVQAFTKQK